METQAVKMSDVLAGSLPEVTITTACYISARKTVVMTSGSIIVDQIGDCEIIELVGNKDVQIEVEGDVKMVTIDVGSFTGTINSKTLTKIRPVGKTLEYHVDPENGQIEVAAEELAEQREPKKSTKAAPMRGSRAPIPKVYVKDPGCKRW